MIDWAIYVVGSIVLFSGGFALACSIAGFVGWQLVEWWYRRYCDVMLLREFIKWKRNRYPG